MEKYVIKNYQKGFEEDQARIGIEVAKNWVWPYAYTLEELLKLHGQHEFDPDTRHYCFLEEEMVGYMFSTIPSQTENDEVVATLDFPRLLPGHEHAADRLMNRALETLAKKGVHRVLSRVTTMCPRGIELAEKAGFNIHDWGYKIYYSYEMDWGRISAPRAGVREIDPARDLDNCAELASRWYKRSAEWCRSLLEEWHKAGTISHSGVRKDGTLIAACLVARNDVRPSTAANYYIYAADEDSLRPLLINGINKCVDCGVHNIIADLINEHRAFEPVYQEIGFKKVAEWARCEKLLT